MQVPMPKRNVSEALDGLQKYMLYVSKLNVKSLIQMRILVEYRIQMHMPTEHIQYLDNYTILPMQKAGMFTRCARE